MAAETEEIRGIGHSVRRVEDDRFIRGAGNYIVINGKGTKRDYMYAHMKRKPRLRKGERVRKGEQIGKVRGRDVLTRNECRSGRRDSTGCADLRQQGGT